MPSHDTLAIRYPCTWEFCIIGHSSSALSHIISTLLKKPYSLIEHNRSSRGRFVSMLLCVEVVSEQERNDIYQRLCVHKDIAMVI